MMYNKSDDLTLFSSGGLGDAFLTTPVFKAFKQKYPNNKLTVICVNQGHYDVYRFNPYIDKLVLPTLRSLPFDFLNNLLFPGYFFRKYKGNRYGALSPSKYYECHASTIIAEMLGLTLNSEKLECYLTEDELIKGEEFMKQFKNPVLIHITSLTSSNQHWPLENWHNLVKSLPECTFIQLGKTSEKAIPDTIDLRDKTSVRESVALLKYAKSFIGVVSSMAHAAGAAGVSGVVLHGPSNPQLWGHKNNISLYKSLHCSPCIDTLYSVACPYNKKCMTDLTVKDVIAAVKQQLSKRASGELE